MTMQTVFAKIQIRRGTAAEWANQNPTLGEGEMAYETDTKLHRIGDGFSDYANLPAYATFAAVEAAVEAANQAKVDAEEAMAVAVGAASAAAVNPPYASIAAFEAATVPAEALAWSIIQSGVRCEYIRDDTGTACTSANGVKGSPSGIVTPLHWGWDPDDMTAQINAALAFVGGKGGGTVYGGGRTYRVSNSNPDSISWDTRVAIWFRHSNVKLDLEGGKLVLADMANCHVVQIGQRSDGVTLAANNCGVVNFEIDGNRANQTTPTELDYHWSGIDVACGVRQTIRDFHIHDTTYYGIGFQGEVMQFNRVSDGLIEDTGADGFDAKDRSGLSKGNKLTGVDVFRHGLVTALAVQAGINYRGGWKVSNVGVYEFSGDRHGIRGETSTVDNPLGSELSGYTVVASARDTTVGFYDHNDSARSRLVNGTIAGCGTGFHARYRPIASNLSVDDCATGVNCGGVGDALLSIVRVSNCDTGLNFSSDTNIVGDAHITGCTVGINVESGADYNAVRTGLIEACVTKVADAGVETAISGVMGYRTHSVGTANVPIDSTGEKTVTIAHNLDSVPLLTNVRLTLQRNTVVADYSLGYMNVYQADATNVYCKVRVLTASATAGATVTLMAECVAKKALRQ